LRSALLSQDLIFVGGGNTANMLAIWRIHGVDEILREAWNEGIVLCGVSAAAICWFESSVTDSFGRQLGPLHDGLGFLSGSFCPHYDGEVRRRPVYQKLVANRTLPSGYAADDGVAVMFRDAIFSEAVSMSPNASAWRVEYRESDQFAETVVSSKLSGSSSPQ
jgi:dipeptidase E